VLELVPTAGVSAAGFGEVDTAPGAAGAELAEVLETVVNGFGELVTVFTDELAALPVPVVTPRACEAFFSDPEGTWGGA
jgi:hypothetical protein